MESTKNRDLNSAKMCQMVGCASQRSKLNSYTTKYE